MPERPGLIFSCDVECWGQSVLDRELPIQPHSATNVRRLLDLLAEVDPRARGTFFVLGKFAERHPEVVTAIHQAGHEIASHGHGHEQLFQLTPDQFRTDLRRAVATLADITGHRPAGYRAPVFSIVRPTLWALTILAEEGFAYDSSIFPIRGPRYGIPDWPTAPRRVVLPGGRTIDEYPVATMRWGGLRLPVAGGGYARLLPGAVQRGALAGVGRRQSSGLPVFYCHPYELDPGEIRRCYPGVRWARRLHQSLGRAGFAGKLRGLLRQFSATSFAACRAGQPALPTFILPGNFIPTALPQPADGRRSDRPVAATAAD